MAEAFDTSSTFELHRSNLLRLQVSELLGECRLDVEDKKWLLTTEHYLNLVADAVKTISVVETKYQRLADKPVSVNLKKGELSISPLGCSKVQIGWTKKSANAQVPPTFDLTVQIPVGVFSGKDYMNCRCFDVSFLLG